MFRVTLWEETEITLRGEMVRKFPFEDREDFQALCSESGRLLLLRFSAHGRGCRSSWRWELIPPVMSMKSISAGCALPLCVRIAGGHRFLKRTVTYGLVRHGGPDRGKALLLPALSGDGELSAAVCAALSAGVQPTIEEFFKGGKDRSDVKRWQELLERYRGRYEGLLAELRTECGALFGRSPPQEQALGFWSRVMKACGGLAAATGRLVHELGITLFGR